MRQLPALSVHPPAPSQVWQDKHEYDVPAHWPGVDVHTSDDVHALPSSHEAPAFALQAAVDSAVLHLLHPDVAPFA